MVCIYCQSDTRVVNSRLQKRRNTVWRRRRCVDCGAIFTTTEVIDGSQALLVTSAGHSEPFLRDKLLISIHDSLKHRKSAQADATELTDSIVAQLQTLITSPSVEASMISEVTLSVLGRFDKVAATHYLAFHPEFKG